MKVWSGGVVYSRALVPPRKILLQLVDLSSLTLGLPLNLFRSATEKYKVGPLVIRGEKIPWKIIYAATYKGVNGGG